MIASIRDGWKAAWRQPFLLVTLFVYRFVWGFVLYRTVQSVVVPLLHRYPAVGAPPDRVRLFLAEAEFRLSKTDVAEPYLWLVLGLLLARVALTPLLNAGVFYSLANPHLNTGYRFFKGIKSLARPFYLYYGARLLLTLLPVYFLLPRLTSGRLTRMLSSPGDSDTIYLVAGLLVYGYLLHLLFLHLQFGTTTRDGLGRTLFRALLGVVPIIGTAALLLFLSAILSGTVMALTMVQAGLWTLLLYQAYGFVRTFMSLWGITAQYRLFDSTRRGTSM